MSSRSMLRDAGTLSSTRELGEPELGFLLVCSADFTTAEGFGPDIKLTRTQTIMQGASTATFGTSDRERRTERERTCVMAPR